MNTGISFAHEQGTTIGGRRHAMLEAIMIANDPDSTCARAIPASLRTCAGLTALFLISVGVACAQEVAGSGKEEPSPSATAKEKLETPAKQPFLRWMDNSVSLLPYGSEYKVDPSKQTTLSLEHVHDSGIGDLFVFVDVTDFHENGGGDDMTWYGEVSPRFSVGKILDKDLSFNLLQRSLFEIKDVLLATGYERGEEDDNAEAALVGIGFDLDVRKAGFLGPIGKFKYIQLNLYARNELARNSREGFRDMQVSMVAAYPFKIGSARFLVDGYFDWNTGIGTEEWSYHFNPQFKLDVGNFWGKPEKFYAGVELDFWWNKYQIPDSSALDTDQAAVSLLVKYHF